MRSIAFLLFFVGGALLAPGAWAQAPSEGRPPPHPHDIVKARAAELGIDAETVQAVEAVASGAKAERERLQEVVERAREDLQQLLEAEEPDRAAVIGQVEALGAAETAMLLHQLVTLLDMRALLSPEQREALGVFGAAVGPPAGGGPPPGSPPPGGPPAGVPPPPGFPPPGS